MRDFTEIVDDIDSGRVSAQARDELAKVAEAVMRTGKQGKVTLEFNLKRHRDGQCVIKALCKSTIPQEPTEAAVFFTDADGGLYRDDPRQVPLRGVPSKPPAKLRTIAHDTDEKKEV